MSDDQKESDNKHDEENNNNEQIDPTLKLPDSETKEKVKTEEGQEDYNPLKPLSSLQDALDRLHYEINFAAKNLDATSGEVRESINQLITELQVQTKEQKDLLEEQKSQHDQREQELKMVTLLPEKFEKRITNLVPRISEAIQEVHAQRIESIGNGFAELTKQFNEDALTRQKLIEETAAKSIAGMESKQQEISKLHKQELSEFKEMVSSEVKAITENHGGKFLRNLIITMIMAAITGGITSWCVGRYFPVFMSISKTGNVSIEKSHVKVLRVEDKKINYSGNNHIENSKNQ